MTIIDIKSEFKRLGFVILGAPARWSGTDVYVRSNTNEAWARVQPMDGTFTVDCYRLDRPDVHEAKTGLTWPETVEYLERKFKEEK